MTLQKILENNNLEPRPYSGRGMLGKSCLAFPVSREEFLYIMLNIGAECEVNNLEIPYNVKWDDFGMDYMIYFPRIKFQESNPDTGDN